jgi:hypothetical protein
MSADFKANVVDDLGNVQPASTVTVRDVNGALIPAGELFSDAALTIPFAANPFTTDAQGNMNFFIEPQTVNITAQKGAFVKTWDDYVLNEQIDTSDFATSAQGTLADSATQPGDLGTAAALDSTTGNLDTTAGRVLLVENFGIGTTTLDDHNADSVAGTGFFRDTSGGFYNYFGGVSQSQAEVVQMVRLPTAQTSQLAIKNGPSASATRAAVRHRGSDGPWSDVQELWTFGNYQPEESLGLGVSRVMKNISGATVSDQAVVAGSDIQLVLWNSSGTLIASSQVIPGSWVNATGRFIEDDLTSIFTRVS